MFLRLLMRVPYVRRPFYRHAVARRERDAQLRQLEVPDTAERAQHRDIAGWFGADQFYWCPQQDEQQDRQVGDFRSFIRKSVAPDQPAVEVGPSLRPILPKRLGFDVTIVDHADEHQIAAKYAAEGLDVSAIEPVDVVWNGNKLSTMMPRRDMAAVVACHMIEHATDFIGFLNDCADMLASDGRILLIVPDRRYCFDFLHAPSDVAKVLDDHRQQRRLHSFRSLYRNTSNVAARTNGIDSIAWSPHEIDDIVFVNGDPNGGLGALAEATHYINSHENYFTPSSFVLLIEELRYLGMLELTPRIVTRTRACEFLVVLTKTVREAARPSLGDYLARKKFLALNMLREEREWLQGLSKILDATA